jgi:hypothetical protein
VTRMTAASGAKQQAPEHASTRPAAAPARIGHFSQGVQETLFCQSAHAAGATRRVVGGRLWLTGFPLCLCKKYGKLARTDLKNERISRSGGGFQACYEIIRGVVGGLNSS